MHRQGLFLKFKWVGYWPIQIKSVGSFLACDGTDVLEIIVITIVVVAQKILLLIDGWSCHHTAFHFSLCFKWPVVALSISYTPFHYHIEGIATSETHQTLTVLACGHGTGSQLAVPLDFSSHHWKSLQCRFGVGQDCNHKWGTGQIVHCGPGR